MNLPARLARLRRPLLLLAAAPLLALLAWAGGLWLTGNVHPVTEGQVYRSAQLGPGQLAGAVHRYGIRTVLNLRGPNPGKAWFDQELAASAELGVRHLDLALSAREELSDAQLAGLVDILRRAPRPLLIHCEGGSDRTGLAAAVFHLAVERRAAAEARAELNPWYGHLTWLFPRTAAMDRSFDRLAGQLAAAPAPQVAAQR